MQPQASRRPKKTCRTLSGSDARYRRSSSSPPVRTKVLRHIPVGAARSTPAVFVSHRSPCKTTTTLIGMDGAPRAQGARCFCLSTSRLPNAGYEQQHAAAAPAASLPTHLQHLKLSQLQRMALDAGVGADRVEEAVDEADPRAAIAELLAAAAAPADQDAARREELEGLKLSELKRRAVAAGPTTAEVEDALDSESPKEALIELLLLATQPDAAEARSLDLSLRQELAPLKLGALQVNAPRPPPSLLTCSFMWLSNRGLACRRHGRSLPVQTRPQWTRLWMPTTGRRSSRSSSSELSLISPSQ